MQCFDYVWSMSWWLDEGGRSTVPGINDLSLHDEDSLRSEPISLLLLAGCANQATGADHAPPWDVTVTVAENRAYRAGGTGKPCLIRHLAVGDHLAELE